MKRTSVSVRLRPGASPGRVCKVILGIVLFSLVLLAFGCSSCEQLGETAAEGHRRHLRNLRINHQEMMWDIDRAFLADQPSRLSDKRIP